MKVFKVKNLFNYRGEYYLGSCSSRDDKDPFPVGKVVLSLPYKKGRRKLVKGYVYDRPYSCPYNGLQYEYYFKPLPNQETKLLSLLGAQ